MNSQAFCFYALFWCFFLLKSIAGDPGRDTCKIVSHAGLKCTDISSYFFPYDTFLSFNDDIAQFTNEMKYLEIGHSNISVLQGRSFQRTPYISHLVLKNIFLMKIETGAFEGLKRLKLVDLSHNLLQEIPLDAFKHTKISRLNLEGNLLLETPKNDPILSARFLSSLSLKNCNLQQLPGSAFQETPALVHLDLSQNDLKNLPGDLFASLKHLAFLDLSENRFQTLDVRVLESMPSFPKFPTALLLSSNPWTCDCSIKKLGEWATANAKTGVWSEKPENCRLKKLVECQQPKRISWNTIEFKELLSSC